MNCGIYQILNLSDGKRYVGSSSDMRRRWKDHLNALRRGGHHNNRLSRSWAKHGEASFQFQPLLYCSPSDLIFYEELAFSGLKPEYNAAPVAGSTRGISYSDEARQKISKAMMGNKRAVGRTTSEAQKSRMVGNKFGAGIVKSQAVRDKLSRIHKGNSYALGTKHTPESKAARSKMMKAQWAAKKLAGHSGRLSATP